MTDKEYRQIITTMLVISSLFIGLFVGEAITSLRYDSEIRTDQLGLKGKVEKIEEDKQMVQNLVTELLSQTKSVKAERKALEELRIKLSKGEKNAR